MKIEELRNKKIAIVGFAVEGEATLRFLKHFLPDADVVVTDQKDGPTYLQKIEDADVVIKTAGIPGRLIPKPYTTATNIFFANSKGTIIGVTGSKGKSTTASLIFDMLKAAGFNVKLAGNIGKPMLDELLVSEGEDRYYVCELSSYQLEDLQQSPHIGVFINFFPEHLDYHGSLEQYWNAKRHLISYQTSRDFFVYNSGDPKLAALAREVKSVAVPFETSLPFPPGLIPMPGAHNVLNVRAAVTVAHLLEVGDQAITSAIKAFKPLPHRLQNIGTYKGITFYDDAISTTPESTIAALEALPPVGTLFLGGTDRGYDFSELARTVLAKKITNVVLFPDSGAKIAVALGAAALRAAAEAAHAPLPHIFETRDMAAAVAWAYQKTPPGTICLLSTASPSYSVWKNFEEKGNLFQKCVRDLQTPSF